MMYGNRLRRPHELIPPHQKHPKRGMLLREPKAKELEKAAEERIRRTIKEIGNRTTQQLNQAKSCVIIAKTLLRELVRKVRQNVLSHTSLKMYANSATII